MLGPASPRRSWILAMVAATVKACTAAAWVLTPPSSAVQAVGLGVCSSRICAFRTSRLKRALAVLEASKICSSAPTEAF